MVSGGWSSERGVTPVVGVLLIAALALLLGAIVMMSSLGTVEEAVGDPMPNVVFGVDFDREMGALTLVHRSGHRFAGADADRLVVRVVDASDGTVQRVEWGRNAGTVEPESRFVVDDANGPATGNVTLTNVFERGDVVQVVWSSGRRTYVLREYEVPAAARTYVGWRVPDDGLRAHYAFEEEVVTVRDAASGTADAGRVRGATVGAPGRVGTAYAFDGSSHVALRESFGTRGRFASVSACAWFNTDVTGVGEFDNWALVDFDRSEYFDLYVRGDTGGVGFSTADQDATSHTDAHDLSTAGGYADGNWHLACGVYDGTDKRVYVDGALEATATNPHGGKALGTGATRYGFLGDGSEADAFDGDRNAYGYEGSVDDVRVYDRALSAGEVGDLYAAASGGASAPSTGLLAHYPLDETAGAGPGSGSVTDGAGAAHGSNRGATTGVPGAVGNAYAFDDGGYVALPASYDAAESLPAVTACAWFRTSASGGRFDNWAFVDFDRSEYFNLYVQGTDGAVGFSTSAPGSTMRDQSAGGPLYDGAWHHACGVYDGTDKHVYVDGTLEGTATNPHGGKALGTGATRYGIVGDGSEADTFDGPRNENYYDGRLDEVRLYHRALAPDEVATLHALTVEGTATTPARSFPEPVALDRLRVEARGLTLPAGATVEVVVEADTDGDGSYDTVSDPVTVTGGPAPVTWTGSPPPTADYRLRVTTTGGAALDAVDLVAG